MDVKPQSGLDVQLPFYKEFMRKLLDFLLRKKHWFIFILLEVLSVILIYRNNLYQRSALLSSANYISGHLATVTGGIRSYFHLKKINRNLQEQNGKMEMELLNLQEQIDVMLEDTVSFKGYARDSIHSEYPFQFVMASVINNSFSQVANYITLNKGKNDGIAPDMGVVSDQGVVGIVSHVSDHFSVVISLLNPKSKISCKVLGNNSFGYLSWNGMDVRYATLEELPRHAEFQKGDTVVTSGYSAIFPPGLIVGTVEGFNKEHDDNFYELQVRLSTSFSSLQNVRVIRNTMQQEQLNLEREAKKND